MFITEILIACLLFIILLVVFAYLIVFYKDRFKRIKNSIEDETFDINSYNEEKSQKKVKRIIWGSIATFLITISTSIFAMSLSLRLTSKSTDTIVMSVNSDSMATALSSNSYVKANNLSGKIAIYDVCEFEKPESKKDIELYDVVLYKVNQNEKVIYVVHRIIKINDDSTYETRGDNNIQSDNFNLEFEQILGVYKKTYGFASFLNYLTYTPGFYVAYAGAIFYIVITTMFEEKEKKLVK